MTIFEKAGAFAGVTNRAAGRIRGVHTALTMAVGAVLLATGVSVAAEPRTLMIHAGMLLAEPGESPLPRRTLVVKDGRISAVLEGFAEPEGGDGSRVVDLSGYFVMPGLIDSHVHITAESRPGGKLRGVEQTGADQAMSGAMNARRTLMAGFTTVRDAAGFRGNDFDAVFALRDAIAAGKVAGPRLVVAGQGLTPTAGHGDFMGFRPDIEALLAPEGICDGADDCRRTTRYMVKRGADFIKVAVTGGVTSLIQTGLDQQMTDAELTAIVDTAHALGRKVAAHAHGVNGINAALAAGVDSIEHGTFMDSESVRLFRRTGAYLVPTMLATLASSRRVQSDPTLPPEIRTKTAERPDAKAAQVRMAYEKGVRLAFGTDSAISIHGANAEEFRLLVGAGIPPAYAIRMATVHAADLLGVADEVGALRPGMAADVVAVMGDPLQDISVLEDIRFVMKSGFIHRFEDVAYAIP